MPHTCHARGCNTPVRPTLLMCARHWRRVPPRIQRAVYATYRAGQCDDKKPSRAWHEAASAAIAYLAIADGHKITKNEALALCALGERGLVEDYAARRGMDLAKVREVLDAARAENR